MTLPLNITVQGEETFQIELLSALQVGDKTDWDVGVAKESVNRKGSVTVRPDQGYWAVCRRKGSHLSACAGPSVPLHLRKKPRKVGVFVDFEEINDC